jgi:hypothetical protein
LEDDLNLEAEGQLPSAPHLCAVVVVVSVVLAEAWTAAVGLVGVGSGVEGLHGWLISGIKVYESVSVFPGRYNLQGHAAGDQSLNL